MPDPSFLEIALQNALKAVRRSARMIRRRRREPPVPSKKEDGSVVTEVDFRSETLMREILQHSHPDHAIVGEEGSREPGQVDGWTWLLDPLDGTRAYAARQENCCVAATLTRRGIPLLTAVAAPFSGEIYTAIRGQVTKRNGQPIRALSTRPAPEREFLLNYDHADSGRAALYGLASRGELGRLTVLPGSFILNCCRVAEGGYDAYLSIKRHRGTLMPWDLAPAALVLDGAGAILVDLQSRQLGGMIPARETIAGPPDTVADFTRQFGTRIRDPRPELGWAHDYEGVFARLYVRLVTSPECRIIGIAGAGGGIGKTTFAREMKTLLLPQTCQVVSLDDYLIPRAERDALGIGAHDAGANDLTRAAADLSRLRAGLACTKPVYDHELGRSVSTETLEPSRFVIVEGVLALHPTLRDSLDLGIFLDASPSVRYRRVARDVEEKGLSEAYAKAAHQRLEEECRRYLLPLREVADVVILVEDAFRLKWIRPE